ncbi:sensor histidine kinase [soil metagenome]
MLKTPTLKTFLRTIAPFIWLPLLLGVFLLRGQPAVGQAAGPGAFPAGEFRMEHLSVKQGLSHNFVTSILQDREGFMWIGTRDGLNRYDGYRFSVFQPDPIDPDNTLGHNWIMAIHEDRVGRLWVTTAGGGLHQLDKRTGKATSFLIDSADVSERNIGFLLHEDRQGHFWIPTPLGLNRFEPDQGSFRLYRPPGLAKGWYFGEKVFEDQRGVLWVGSQQGLYQFDPQTGTYTPFRLGTGKGEAQPAIRGIEADPDGKVWVALSDGSLYRLEPDKAEATFYPSPVQGTARGRGYKISLLTNQKDAIWMGLHGEGLFRLDVQTGEWTTVPVRQEAAGSLASDVVEALALDRSGILWIGTDNGLTKLLPHPAKFRTVQVVREPEGSRLPENRIGALHLDKGGTIWLSNAAGQLYSFDQTTQRLHQHPLPLRQSGGGGPRGISAIYEDLAGQLWLGAGPDLIAFDRKGGQHQTYRSEVGVRVFREDAVGNLWVGANGLASFNPRTQTFTYYRHNPADPGSLGDDFVETLLPARSGHVWVGSNRKGLSRLDPATGTFTHFRPDRARPEGQLNDRDIRSLYEDRGGILWVGTNQGGLNRFDPATATFTAFTTHDGLPSNYIGAIEADEAGHLWLATHRGLSRFHPETRAIRNYNESDGLQDNQFYDVSSRGPTGELVFGGPNGINVFQPQAVQEDAYLPPVHITGFRVRQQVRPFPDGQIKLAHHENQVAFEFVGLNFVQPEKTQYAYRLDGVDPDWVYSGTRRFAGYTNLAPGTYTFRVKATNHDGVWNEEGDSLQLLIYPPFWRTWWFIALCVLAAAGLMYGGFRYYGHRIKQEEAQKTAYNKRLAEMEMQALRAQMNPHFIFNSLNSINRFILKNEPDEASNYLSKFSKLIRLILQHSSSPTVTLERELEALELYLQLEAVRFEGRFTHEVRLGPEVEADYIEIPPLLLQPYVENAIWHGLMHKEGRGHLLLDLRLETNTLDCTIEDNGVGRKKAAELKSKTATRNKSMGMDITAHRLELLNAVAGGKSTVQVEDLVDPEGEPCGTRVVLRIPVSYD